MSDNPRRSDQVVATTLWTQCSRRPFRIVLRWRNNQKHRVRVDLSICKPDRDDILVVLLQSISRGDVVFPDLRDRCGLQSSAKPHYVGNKRLVLGVLALVARRDAAVERGAGR